MKSCEEFAKYKDKMLDKEVIVATSNESQKTFFKKHFEKDGYSVTIVSDAKQLQKSCEQSSCGILILNLSLQNSSQHGALFELSQNCCSKRFVIVNKSDKIKSLKISKASYSKSNATKALKSLSPKTHLRLSTNCKRFYLRAGLRRNSSVTGKIFLIRLKNMIPI
jgi:DNA-binding NtrC family response regulator